MASPPMVIVGCFLTFSLRNGGSKPQGKSQEVVMELYHNQEFYQSIYRVISERD